MKRPFFAPMPLAAIFVLLILLFPSVTAQGQTYIFGRADFPVGNSAIAIAAGDFNGDGLTDFAVVNYADNTVSVLLGRVDGTLAPQVTYPTNPGPIAIAAADFNGDGRVDLAVANANCPVPYDQCTSSTVSILLGNGDGTFQPHIDLPVGALPTSVVAADFNGDGKADLAVANAFDGTISVLLGNGDGTFQPQTTYDTVGTLISPGPHSWSWASLAVGDFNNDGKLDLAVTCSTAISVLPGKGDGTFGTHIDSGVGANFLAAGDFNGDGKLDLIVTGENGPLSVLLGLGDGTFVLQSQYASGTYEVPAVADVNGDGKLDVLVPLDVASYSVAILLGNGDGTFQSPVLYGTANTPISLWLGDLNGDGKLDLAVVTTTGCPIGGNALPNCAGKPAGPGVVSVLLGLGDGTFVGTTAYPTDPNGGGYAVASADFNNDGKLDLAAAGLGASVSVLLGNGDGTFKAQVSYPVGPSPLSLAAGDFANNGNIDLVTANGNNCGTPTCGPGSVSVLLGNGDGTFQPHTDYGVGLMPSSVAVGDFRSNGNLDLAVVDNGSSSVSILLGKGNGTFQPQVSYLTASTASNQTFPQLIAIGDFNQDGKPDLAVATTEAVSILLGNGDGTFQSHVDIPIAGGPSAIATADFNGDGKLDLAVSDGNGISILLGNGDGTFQAPVNYPNAVVSSIVVTDFNGDGKLDLALAGGFILLGKGDGTFQQPIGYILSNSYSLSLTVGDFNGDGTPDWATGSFDPDTVDVMLSTAFKAIAPASLNFGSQGTGTTSNPQTITISNPSNVKINFASIASSGNFSDTNNCGVSLSLGASCQVSVTFSPTATGSQSGSITITDSTRISPLAIPLSGTGVNGPFLTSYPSQQNFSPQAVGVSSSPAAIVLENTGNASLNMTGISIAGTNSSDFTQTNNCAGSLAPAGACTVNVKFTPTAGGPRMANLSVSDTAPGGPQAIVLSGMASTSDFTISGTGPATKSVNPGQSATFTLSLAPSGAFSGTVNLQCSITPAVTLAPTCTFSNSSVQVSGGTAQSVTLTVGTTASASSGVISNGDFRPGPSLLAWFSMILGTACLLLRYRTRLSRVGSLAVVLALATLVGCGGRDTSTHTGAGTPFGTYTVAIEATSGSTTHTMQLQVDVQ